MPGQDAADEACEETYKVASEMERWRWSMSALFLGYPT